MKKKEARKKFGNDVFYKLFSPTTKRILVITNNKDFVEKEKLYWDSVSSEIEYDATTIEEIDFDTAFNLLWNDTLIIRRFYEHE